MPRVGHLYTVWCRGGTLVLPPKRIKQCFAMWGKKRKKEKEKEYLTIRRTCGCCQVQNKIILLDLFAGWIPKLEFYVYYSNLLQCLCYFRRPLYMFSLNMVLIIFTCMRRFDHQKYFTKKKMLTIKKITNNSGKMKIFQKKVIFFTKN